MNKLRIISLLILVFCLCLPGQTKDSLGVDIPKGMTLQVARKLHPTLVVFPDRCKQVKLYYEPTGKPAVFIYIFSPTNDGTYKYKGQMVAMKGRFEDVLAIMTKDKGAPTEVIEHDQAIWKGQSTKEQTSVLLRSKNPEQLKLGYRTCLMICDAIQ